MAKRLAKSDHARAVYKKVKAEYGSTGKPEEVVWAFIDSAAAVFDGMQGIPYIGPCASVASAIRTGIGGSGADGLIDNPYFIGNGHGEDDPSSATQSYMRGRMGKSIGAGVASAAGAVGSIWTAVDIAGIGMHGNATGTTAAHLAVLGNMARKVPSGGTLQQWLMHLIKMKTIKMTARTAGLIGSSVPIPAAGITTGVIAAAAAAGAKLTLTHTCMATALELHWRAWQEQFMTGVFGGSATGGKIGPASKIVYEIFTKRGMTRVLGKHATDRFIQEPAGWNALYDKISLI